MRSIIGVVVLIALSCGPIQADLEFVEHPSAAAQSKIDQMKIRLKGMEAEYMRKHKMALSGAHAAPTSLAQVGHTRYLSDILEEHKAITEGHDTDFIKIVSDVGRKALMRRKSHQSSSVSADQE